MTASTDIRPPILAVHPAAPRLVGRTFTVFGTFGSLFVTRAEALGPACRLVAARLAEIDLACSRFRPDSELTAVNRAAGRTVSISPLLVTAIVAGLRAAAATDGDVDPTCGDSLARLGYDRDFTLIGRAAAAPVCPVPAGGWRRVELDADRGTVRLPAGVRLDLGATAKALAADMTAALVAAECDTAVLVNLGGDIAVAGQPPDGGWPVGIAAGPHDTVRIGGYGPVVGIWDGGLATSSPLARSWLRGSRRLHHIIVPATGLPAETCWSAVTVAAATCVDANTASTAAIIRGGLAPAWLSGLGLPARLVRPDGSVVATGGWPQ